MTERQHFLDPDEDPYGEHPNSDESVDLQDFLRIVLASDLETAERLLDSFVGGMGIPGIGSTADLVELINAMLDKEADEG